MSDDDTLDIPCDPKPGSIAAWEQGCTCPVVDNGYGRGCHGDGARWGWWVTEGCPVHAPAKEDE